MAGEFNKKKVIFISVVAMIVCIVLYFFLNFQIYRIEGNSMSPTLLNNQLVLMKKTKKIEKYDLVVFKKNGKTVCKRVVACEGVFIKVTDTRVSFSKEPFDVVFEVPNSVELNVMTTNTVAEQLSVLQRVPSGNLFVLGDNATSSHDSREFGFVEMEEVVGVVAHFF